MTDNQSADIVERLRQRAYSEQPLCNEAADEIERLRERCEAYKGQVEVGATEIERLRDEIERLRAAISEIKQATLDGRVCDDVAWFDEITTLHDYCDNVLSPTERGGGKVMSEPLMHTDKDREYAIDLLEDLDIKPTGPQLEIATQWFCKARVEHALWLRGGGKS